jgi:hypothetical protein
VFEVMATGMYVQTGKGSNGNGEGGANKNVAVVNNEFYKVNKMGHRMGGMIIAAEIPTVANPGARVYSPQPFMSDMLISGNVLTNTPGIGINIHSTSRVLVTNNTIRNDVHNLPAAGQIVVGSGRDITVRGNWWAGNYIPVEPLIYGQAAMLGTLCLSDAQPNRPPFTTVVQGPVGLDAQKPAQAPINVVPQQPSGQQPIHKPVYEMPPQTNYPTTKPTTEHESAGVDLDGVVGKALAAIVALVAGVIVWQNQPGRDE